MVISFRFGASIRRRARRRRSCTRRRRDVCFRAHRGWGVSGGSSSSSALPAPGRRSSRDALGTLPGFVDLGRGRAAQGRDPTADGKPAASERIRTILDRVRRLGLVTGLRAVEQTPEVAFVARRRARRLSAGASRAHRPRRPRRRLLPARAQLAGSRTHRRRRRAISHTAHALVSGSSRSEPRSSSTRASRHGRPGRGGATSPRGARRRSGRSRSATSRWRSPTTRSPHTWRACRRRPGGARGRPLESDRPLSAAISRRSSSRTSSARPDRS